MIRKITRLGLICGLERRAGVEVIGEAENGEAAESARKNSRTSS